MSPIDIPHVYIDYDYVFHLLWCILGTQTRFCYLTRILVCTLWILSSSICRLRRQHLVEVLLQGWLIIHSLDIVVMTQFQKDQLSPAMQARIERDLPVCSSLSMLVGSSPLLITLKALGSRLWVSTGKKGVSPTTSHSTMKKSQVATKENVCLSLPVAKMINRWATMTSRWIMSASTPGWPPLKRPNMPSRTPCTSTLSCKQTWETPSLTSSSSSSKRMRTGTTCSRSSTSTHHSEQL